MTPPCHGHTMGWAPHGDTTSAGTSSNPRLLRNGGPHGTAGVQSPPHPLFGGGCFSAASPYPALRPLHPAGVPAGGPSCAAAATKGDEYVMLRCRWEGGTPPATLRWRDGGGQALGDPSPSAAVLVLSADGSLGGRDFVCAAAHPLRAAGAECRLRLGKPDPSPRAPPAPRWGCTSLPAPSPPSRRTGVPELEAERSEVAVLEGGEARLACQRRGGGANLGARVVWYDPKEREVTAGSAKYRLERGEAWVNLTVRDAEWPGDGGIYRCAAANAVGTARLPVHLRVDRESWEGRGGPQGGLGGGWSSSLLPGAVSPQGTRPPPTSPSASCGTRGRAPRCGWSGGRRAPATSPASWYSGAKPRNPPGGRPAPGKRPPATSSPTPATGAWGGWTQPWSTLSASWLSTTGRPGTPPRCRRQVKQGGAMPLSGGRAGFEWRRATFASWWSGGAECEQPSVGFRVNRHRLPPPSAFLGSAGGACCLPRSLLSLCWLTCGCLVTLITPGGTRADSSRSLPAEPPFEAYPAVTGAAVAGMLVATAASLLAVRCVARHRDSLPRECQGRVGVTAGPRLPTPHVRLSVPRAARPALPHVSAQSPLAHGSHTPAPGRDPCVVPPQGRARRPGAHRHAGGCRNSRKRGGRSGTGTGRPGCPWHSSR